MEITVKIPDKIKGNPRMVADTVINQVIGKIAKATNCEVDKGSGGTLDDWKDGDLKNSDGMLILFTIKEKPKRIYSKRNKGKYQVNINKEMDNYTCTLPNGGVGCSHKINDKCEHKCHKTNEAKDIVLSSY